MSQALNEFNLRLADLENDLSLLEYAFELRPRIKQVLDPSKQGAVLDLAMKFGNLEGNQPESFYGPMLIRLVASFERYLRLLMRDAVEGWAKRAKTFDQLPDGLGDRNLVLSGRLIGNSDSPRDHLSVDLFTLVDNLPTCRNGSVAFRLNPIVFMDLINGITPDVIERGLKAIRINNWQNVIGADKNLQVQLACNRTSDATKQMAARLKELSRWRNNWAHGGDNEVSLTITEVKGALEFLSAFSKALDLTVTKQIHAAKSPKVG
jgi:hypothetical protein